MSKMQVSVGAGAFGSSINSPLGQNSFLKSKNNHKNIKKAFSVAEATIALLIGSIALGMAAPMITKQIKTQNFTDTQFAVLKKQIEELQENQGSPKGAIMFFTSTVVPESDTNPCPVGWSKAPETWGGMFFRVADETNVINVPQEQSIQEHWHRLPAFNLSQTEGYNSNNSFTWVTDKLHSKFFNNNYRPNFAGKIYRAEDNYSFKIWTAADRENAPSVSNVDETRPKNIPLLACIKD